MKILTSWDDGTKEDLRVVELLKKYKLKGIFFIPTIPTELTTYEIAELSGYFDIGGHTTSHPQDIKKLSESDAKAEIMDNKGWLEDIIGRKIEWFCYPRGRYNEKTIEILKDIGYSYARTALVGNSDKCDNMYRIHPTVHVHKSRKEYEGKKWLDYAVEQYRMAKQKQESYYHIWGHSWEIENQNLWVELEQLFEHIYGNEN